MRARNIALPTRLVQNQITRVFVEFGGAERGPWVDRREQCVQGGHVGFPVFAEDGDVDVEDVGALGEGVAAGGGGDGFAEFAEGEEDAG